MLWESLQSPVWSVLKLQARHEPEQSLTQEEDKSVCWGGSMFRCFPLVAKWDDNSLQRWVSVRLSEAQWGTVRHSEAQWGTVRLSEAQWGTRLTEIWKYQSWRSHHPWDLPSSPAITSLLPLITVENVNILLEDHNNIRIDGGSEQSQTLKHNSLQTWNSDKLAGWEIWYSQVPVIVEQSNSWIIIKSISTRRQSSASGRA